MYAGAVRGTYYGARYPSLTQVPGDGQTACLTNCKCGISEKDDGLYWELSSAENCDDCIAMAAGSPYGTGAEIKAQTDQERAMFAKMGGGKGPGKGYDKSKSVLKDDKAKAEGGGSSSDATAKADRSLRKAGLITHKQMTTEEERSLHSYQSSGHDRINAELRGSRAIRDQHTHDTVTGNIDRVMARSKLKHDVTVHRGIYLDTPHAEAELAKWKPGETIRDPGYVSTTASHDVAKRFGANQVHVTIRAPKGTPAIYMPTARPLSMTSRGSHNEHEVLLGRNLNYRVVSRKDTPGHTAIEVEVVH
jgi:hypothetical protein